MTKKIEVESIKALEPEKVYAVEIADNKKLWDDAKEAFDDLKTKYNIGSFLYRKGDIKFIPPEAMEDSMAEKLVIPNCRFFNNGLCENKELGLGNLCYKKRSGGQCKKKPEDALRNALPEDVRLRADLEDSGVLDCFILFDEVFMYGMEEQRTIFYEVSDDSLEDTLKILKNVPLDASDHILESARYMVKEMLLDFLIQEGETYKEKYLSVFPEFKEELNATKNN